MPVLTGTRQIISGREAAREAENRKLIEEAHERYVRYAIDPGLWTRDNTTFEPDVWQQEAFEKLCQIQVPRNLHWNRNGQNGTSCKPYPLLPGYTTPSKDCLYWSPQLPRSTQPCGLKLVSGERRANDSLTPSDGLSVRLRTVSIRKTGSLLLEQPSSKHVKTLQRAYRESTKNLFSSSWTKLQECLTK